MKHYKVKITDKYQSVIVKTVKANSASEAFNKADFDNRTVECIEVMEV